MASQAEITTKYARAYVKASKKDKGLGLDQVRLNTAAYSATISCSMNKGCELTQV